jgi:hypothetical protein
MYSFPPFVAAVLSRLDCFYLVGVKAIGSHKELNRLEQLGKSKIKDGFVVIVF